MNAAEAAMTDGWYMGEDRLAVPPNPIIVQVIAGDFYLANGYLRTGSNTPIGTPERFGPFVRLVDEKPGHGVASGDFVVDLDTAIAYDQAQTVEGSIVDAHFLIVAFRVDGRVHYRVDPSEGLPYDRILGLLDVGRRLVDDMTTVAETEAGE